jgi:tellurite resistance protein TerC
MSAPPFPLWAWLVFAGIVLTLLFLDLFVLHRNAREVPFGEAMWLSGFWIAVSLAFGGFLLFTGWRMLRRTDDEPADYRNNRTLRLMRRFVPVTEEHHGDNFFVKRDGKRCATPLLAALVVVETTDIIFAVDSVPAVLSVTQTAFVAYSSIVFAVLGLRALYFALEGLVDRFVYLHYGLAVILIFVGAKFVAQGFGVQVPVITSLLVILVANIAALNGLRSIAALTSAPSNSAAAETYR